MVRVFQLLGPGVAETSLKQPVRPHSMAPCRALTQKVCLVHASVFVVCAGAINIKE